MQMHPNPKKLPKSSHKLFRRILQTTLHPVIYFWYIFVSTAEKIQNNAAIVYIG